MAKQAVPFPIEAFQQIGLSYGYPRARRMTNHRQAKAFKALYGTSAMIVADVWSRLRSSTDPLIAIDEYCQPKYLLVLYSWLKSYKSEIELSIVFGISEKSISLWNKRLVTNISNLRQTVIDPNWMSGVGELRLGVTVDGVHFLIEEPRPFTTKASSHKFGGKSALSYEVGLSTCEQKIVWLNGPFLAGTPDTEMFRSKMKAAIEVKQMDCNDCSIHAIADDGYIGKDLLGVLSYRNEFDPPELAYFKDRSLARHERVNGRAKNFRILDEKFRHSRGSNPNYQFPTHKAVVEAIFVTMQLELDHGEMTLFDPYP